VSEQRYKSSGNIFQAAGPEMLNPRSPILVLVQGLTYLAVFAERRPDRRMAEVKDWRRHISSNVPLEMGLLLAHGSNFGRMPFLPPPVIHMGVSGSWTQARWMLVRRLHHRATDVSWKQYG